MQKPPTLFLLTEKENSSDTLVSLSISNTVVKVRFLC